MTRVLCKWLIILVAGYILGTALTVRSLYELKADACPVDSKVCV